MVISQYLGLFSQIYPGLEDLVNLTYSCFIVILLQNESRGEKENVVTMDGCMMTRKGTFIGGGKAAESVLSIVLIHLS